MSTVGELKSLLARSVGDALVTGSPAYLQGSGFKFAEPEYKASIDFAIDLLKRMYMLRQESAVRFGINLSIYEITPPTGMVYITEMVREDEVDNGQYETVIPLDIVTVRRDGAGPVVHLDRNEVQNKGLFVGSANVMFRGYQYQANITDDDTQVSINTATVIQAARSFLFNNSPARDPQELLKGLRQAEMSRQVAERLADETGTLEPDGGIWLDA